MILPRADIERLLATELSAAAVAGVPSTAAA